MPTIELQKNQAAIVFDAGQENNNTTVYLPDFVIENSKNNENVDVIYIYCAAMAYLTNDEEFVNMAIERFNKQMSEEVENDKKSNNETVIPVTLN